MLTRSLKIGIVCPYSWDTPGGVQNHIRDLAEFLIAAGHEVSVLAPAIDADLQAISKRWGQISDRAESNINGKELERYQFVTA